ncbi:hypothetical protein [Qipengyuania flava]|uniref:hypothetical protein n=1 Tax=Qipengyuania flava TaxID=192812 RepID=UPI001CD4BA30|nr:hypothetical protein [Qipengyuania flava]MCA0891256.1 hypothetical protein [Qipengyuania flava]
MKYSEAETALRKMSEDVEQHQFVRCLSTVIGTGFFERLFKEEDLDRVKEARFLPLELSAHKATSALRAPDLFGALYGLYDRHFEDITEPADMVMTWALDMFIHAERILSRGQAGEALLELAYDLARHPLAATERIAFAFGHEGIADPRTLSLARAIQHDLSGGRI